MSGSWSGVATQLRQEEPKAIYTHCYGHALNLACGDTTKQCKLVRFTHKITKIIKKSPRRDTCFKHLKAEIAPDTPGISVLYYALQGGLYEQKPWKVFWGSFGFMG